MVGRDVMKHKEKNRSVENVVSWEETESDEFTRRAIEAGLLDVDKASFRTPISSSTNEVLDMYRYVGERLRHRMRNVMLSSQTQIVRLRKLMEAQSDSDVVTTLGKLNDSIVALGRVLEASDVDPDYFDDHMLVLADWLRNMNMSFSSKYTPVFLHIEGTAVDSKVLANDYLLENLFWNIWLNAHQVINSQTEITVIFSLISEKVELLVLDNGAGFPAKFRTIAFSQSFSTNSISRGRGLMEMQDAVKKLRGEIGLRTVEDGSIRLYMRFPRQR